MKRFRDEGADFSESEDDAFDDGDDLMARAAEMMDFDDEEDSGSNSDSASEAEAPQNKRQKPNGRKKSASPADEALQDDLEAVNILQLQVDALLASIKCPSAESSKAAPIRELIERLKAVIEAMPSHEAHPAQEAKASLAGNLPYGHDQDLSAVQWQMAFSPPESVKTCGSWSLGTSHKWKGSKGWTIDVALQMPAHLFQEKDVKDHRYFLKRAYFLAKVKEALNDDGSFGSARYAYLHRNKRKPIIELDHEAVPKCTLRLMPVFDLSRMPFDASRLHPRKNNVRLGSRQQSQSPTPIYNADLASDGLVALNDAFLEEAANSTAGVGQAVLLLKVWSRQRGHQKQAGLAGLGQVFALLAAYTVSGGLQKGAPPAAGNNSWQIFKSVLTFLATRDFTKKSVLAQTLYKHAKAPSESDWSQTVAPVLTDVSGIVNIFAHTASASLFLVQHDARVSLEKLRLGEHEAFRPLLLVSIDQPCLRFDHTALIRIQPKVQARAHELQPEFDSGMSAAVAIISSVLAKALGDRMVTLSIVPDAEQDSASIGIVINPATAARVVDHGPAADDPEAAKAFKLFWGSKAETRRFKDGRILESVVWEANGPAERVRIFEQIISHVLEHHLGITPQDVHYFASAYDRLLTEAAQIKRALYTADPAGTGFTTVMGAFDAFVKSLRDLKGLPLAINSVIPISEGLRYTSTFVPGPIRLSALPTLSLAGNYVPLQECLVIFEGSGKWPEDYHAIQKVKAAFLTKIGESFHRAVAGSRCEVALDLAGSSNGSATFLDILTPEGFAFRLWVHHARERQVLETKLLDEQLLDDDRRPWQQALVIDHQQCIARPAHHAAIAALQSRHASFSTTCRVTKRWLAAHLLAPHIAPELVELLCAKVYLDDDVWEIPHSGVVGFARVLDLLASWSWREEPLAVPVYSAPSHDTAKSARLGLPEAKLASVKSQFARHRKADPGITRQAWYIATEQDLGGRAWEPNVPSKMVAARVKELARACLAVLRQQMPAGNSDVQALFTPPLDSYDFVLHLDPLRVPRNRQAVQSEVKALAQRPTTSQAVRIAFDPVKAFIGRASYALGDTAVLFYDPNGGLVIAGLFNPSIAGKDREFRIALDYSTKPTKNDASVDANGGTAKSSVSLDRHAVVQKLREMSEGLVVRTVVRETGL